MLIVAPITAMLIQMAISRTREYAADQTSAEVTQSAGVEIGGLEATLKGRMKKRPARVDRL